MSKKSTFGTMSIMITLKLDVLRVILKVPFWYYVKYDYSKTRHIVLDLKVFFWYRVKNDCSKTMLDLKFSVRTFGTMLNMIVLKLCV